MSRRRWGPRALRAVSLLCLLVVAVVLVRYARSVDWHAVAASLAALPASTLAGVAALTLASYLVYGGYDLAARAYAGHPLSTRRVLAISLSSYAFALNLGALLGGAGLRYRMYARSGLRNGTIARIVAFVVATNWLGYVALAGLLFAAGAIAPPPSLRITPSLLRAAGIAMLLVACGYLYACAAWRGRTFHVRGHHFRWPSLRLGLLQVALAAFDWALMGTLLWTLLGPAYPWPLVTATLLLSAVATALLHVPAGLGVAEAVFVAVLAGGTPEPRILAALLAWRAAYYLVPLVAAVAFYAGVEARAGVARGARADAGPVSRG
ncbi:MAG: lysylphosphatidylglycerol synthase domain-containing protein [Luteimonas sp.]